MSKVLAICDECGEKFIYPQEGKIEAGFGICGECHFKLMEDE